MEHKLKKLLKPKFIRLMEEAKASNKSKYTSPDILDAQTFYHIIKGDGLIAKRHSFEALGSKTTEIFTCIIHKPQYIIPQTWVEKIVNKDTFGTILYKDDYVYITWTKGPTK